MNAMLTHDPAAALVPSPQLQAGIDPVWIDAERPEDRDAREKLLDRAFGPSRFGKTCERLRSQRLPAAGLSLVARAHAPGLADDQDLGEVVGSDVVGTVRLWHVSAGGVPALMLGPLAVDSRVRRFGIGARLMEAAIERATALGHQAILLVGDAPYYARFGFLRAHTLGLRMPGPVEAERFLGLEFYSGALAVARGPVQATGAVDLAACRVQQKTRLPRAA